jgi:hypothetical protein
MPPACRGFNAFFAGRLAGKLNAHDAEGMMIEKGPVMNRA